MTNANELYMVETATAGKLATVESGVDIEAAALKAAEIISEKIDEKYHVIDTKKSDTGNLSFILMINRDYKPFAVRIRRYMEVS